MPSWYAYCYHCRLWTSCSEWGCHPWDGPPRYYCDDCLDWWDAQQWAWDLWDVLMIDHQPPGIALRQVFESEGLAVCIGMYALDLPDESNE